MRSQLVLLAVLFSSGCATIGARSLPELQSSYSEKVAEAADSQFLLNLVRLRYRDPPAFLDVASLTTQQTVNGTLGLGADLPVGLPPTIRPNIGGGYSVTPTITFLPVRGDDFVRRLVTPVTLSTLTMLCSSGWSISRVFHLAVDRVNDVRNAPRAAGPTPDSPPEYERFVEVANELRTLQLDDRLSLSTLRTAEQGESLLLLLDREGPNASLAEKVRVTLGLPAEGSRYLFSEDFSSTDIGPLRVRLRSVLGAMFYLSQGVEVPPEHEARGLVTVTKNKDGSRFDWQQVLNGHFRVRWSQSEPENVSVKVRHRDTWFYIADDDLESKSTFLLLLQLSTMQAGRNALPMPLLTIPAGR